MTARRRLAQGVGVVAAALALAGCSQISALAPVGGDTITTVRIAANDVLLDKGVQIQRAPVCTTEPDRYSCKGTAVGGGEISVVAPKAEPLRMTVTVAGSQVYDGSVQDVVESAAAVQP